LLGISKYSACGEMRGIFRQTKQKSARIVDPMRKNFVTYDGKSTVISSCDEFLEMPDSKSPVP